MSATRAKFFFEFFKIYSVVGTNNFEKTIFFLRWKFGALYSDEVIIT